LNALVQDLDANGMQVHMHAYGDAAVRQALDAIEHAQTVNPVRDRRHVIAHLGLIDQSDLGRFKELGIVANISALWACMDSYRETETEEFGSERAARMLAYKDLFDSGALVTNGSDWISNSMNPLYSVQVGVTRVCPGSDNPEQKVTLEEMISAYTINGARQFGIEQETGSIEQGKAADLVVLDQNVFTIDPNELVDVKVLMTLLQGSVVFESGATH
jgi:predicted amidohydrolase YtcJ